MDKQLTSLEKLETAIRKAFPELMEFSKGCQAKRKSNGKIYVIGEIYGSEKDVNVREPDSILYSTLTIDRFNEYFDIIGHPITLLHLLRWLGTQVSYLGLNYNSMAYMGGGIQIQLNLSKPLLSQQSEEVIEELVKLIK